MDYLIAQNKATNYYIDLKNPIQMTKNAQSLKPPTKISSLYLYLFLAWLK